MMKKKSTSKITNTVLLTIIMMMSIMIGCDQITKSHATKSTNSISSPSKSPFNSNPTIFSSNTCNNKNEDDEKQPKHEIITLRLRCGDAGQNRNTQPKINSQTTTKNERLSSSTRSSTSTGTIAPPPPPSLIKKINPHYAILYGIILSFNSGLLNGITLSGLLSTIKQPSSAVTGSWTNSALTIASNGITNNKSSFVNNLGLKCILCYFIGSFIAGFLNPYPMNYSFKRHTVRPCFLLSTLLMIGSYFSLVHDSNISATATATNTKATTDATTWILLILLTNGIQNSVTSSLSSNLIRSSHYSGITSDMGTFLGQAVRGNKANGLKLKVFFVLACSFWSGGYWSLGLVQVLGNKVLLISAMIYLLFGIFSI